jgi:hypothetical protein
MATLKTKIQLRRDTAENLAKVILEAGEPAYAIDTKKFAIGDGSTKFSGLKDYGLVTEIPDVSDFVTKSTNQTITGIKTFSTYIQTVENKMALKLRTNDSYETGIVYGTTGNEALTIAIQNPATAFQIVYGTKPSAYGTST